MIELAFDSANETLWYFTSHSGTALPVGASAIQNVIEGLSGTSQKLNPDVANASIGSITFRVVDKASIVTSTLGSQLQLGRSTRRQRVRVYVGFEDLEWSDFTLVQTQLVTEISYDEGAYQFSCADVQREMRKDLFELAKTTLAASLSESATTIEVVSTAAFAMVAHGASYSDSPSATVGYAKIQDEVIKYTGKTATQFTGCTRGALNTRQAEHAVDLSAAADTRTAVDEYVYLEMPAVKLIYALLTGSLTRRISIPGVAGAYLSTPDSVANSVIGDIEGVARARLNDYSGADEQTVIGKWGPTGNQAFGFEFATNGRLRLRYSTDGTNNLGGTSTTEVPFVDGTAYWFKWKRIASSGVMSFYYSAVTTLDPAAVAWTKIGADVAGTAGNLFDSTFDLQVGTRNDVEVDLVGSVYYAEIRNVIDGPAVAACDANAAPVGATSFVSPQTGEVWDINGAAQIADDTSLPTSWHLGVPASYVRLSDFTDPGKKDLWNTADDTQGFTVRLEGLDKIDGKKFIETELALLSGVFMPVYADGALGLRRMANVLAGAAYVAKLDETNLVSIGELVHDFEALHNVLQISWNWEPARKDFTRVNILIDAASVTIHGRADPLKLKFRGLHGSRHSSVILAQRFDSMRDRYTGPPLTTDVKVLPSLNTLEVGDVVRLNPPNVRDFVANAVLDRSFEIQNITVDWVTGDLGLKLFASSRAPSAIAATADPTVLSDAWYSSQGTNLTSVLTISGSNPAHVTGGGTLTGAADMNAAGSIFYFAGGDLVIDQGVTINVVNNVQLRVKGFLQNNGVITGLGRGLAGAAAVNEVPPPPSGGNAANRIHYNPGTAGFLGSTKAAGGVMLQPRVSTNSHRPVFSFDGASINGTHHSVPAFTLAWDGTSLKGLPGDLRGSSGSSGMPATWLRFEFIGTLTDEYYWAGGAGGAGGAGLVIVSRGFAQGVAAKIDLSGANGLAGVATLPPSGLWEQSKTLVAGSGAGGAPGGLLILLDGASATASGLTEAGFVANNGSTPIGGTPRMGAEEALQPGVERVYSYFVGTGDGTTFALPTLSGARGASRVQYVPASPDAVPDEPALTLSAPTNFGLASGTSELLIQSDGTILVRIKVTWTPSLDQRTVGYELQYKPSSASQWSTAPLVIGQGSSTEWISAVSDGIEYDVRIRAAGATREVSEWVTILGYLVIGKTEKPSTVGALSFTDPFLSWSDIADADRRGYMVRYHPGSNTDWASATPAHVQGFITETRFDTGDIAGGSTTFLVKAVDRSGNESAAVASLLVDLRPVVPTSFSVSRQPDGTREFSWATTVPPADLDGLRIRYFLGTTADWNAMTALHTGVLKASPFESNQLAAGVYTFAAKNVDRAGNESASAIFITTVTIGDPRIQGAVEDLKEEPAWAGTKTDCHVDVATGWLVADGLATWASLPATWTAWTSWNATPKSPIVYVREIDIGVKVASVPLVTVVADGAQVIEEQHSDDGSSYSAYAAVGPVLDARYVRIRVTLTGSYPVVKTMRTILSASPLSEIIEDQNSASLTGSYRIGVGDVRVPITKVYSVIKKVDVSLQSVGAGWTWELIDKDKTVGPRIKIYNSSNALADAVFDATVTGV